jgi:hypothetical protein
MAEEGLMYRKLMSIVFALALAGTVFVPRARADSAHERIVLTVAKAPLDLPGRTLAPGTYDLKFLTAEHEILGVWKANGGFVSFFDVVPISRAYSTDHTRLDLARSAPGSPERLVDFYYPEATVGYKFLYKRPNPEVLPACRCTAAGK